MHQTTVAKMEAGSRPTSISEAQAVAEVLGVTIGELLAWEERQSDALAVLAADYDDRIQEVQSQISELQRSRDDAHRTLVAISTRLEDLMEIRSGLYAARAEVRHALDQEAP